MRWCALWIAVACAAGCSGGSEDAAPGPVSGSITGRQFTAKGSVAITGIGTCEVPDRGTQHVVLLSVHLDPDHDNAYLTNPANACAPLHPHYEALEVLLWRYVAVSAETPFSPGVYTIHEDHEGGVAGVVVRLGDACERLLPNALADSGTVKLIASDAARVRGELRFTFDDGTGVSGAFDAPVAPTVFPACGILGIPGDGSPPPSSCSPEPPCSASH